MSIETAPFRQFILKVHSRCDLACDYCYVYTKLDRRWAGRPNVMGEDVVERAAERIAEHARTHRLGSVNVVLHGGEPLLAGRIRLERYARILHSMLDPVTTLELVLQTNGVRLTPRVLAMLREQEIRVGVSLDGPAAAHNRHRRDRHGRGTHDRVVAALRQLRRPENESIYAGLLCTVDLDNDPVATYDGLLDHRPPRIDFLLPEGNWSNPPPGRDPENAATPYAEWLIAVFDQWYGHDPTETSVRFFEDIINVLLGGPATVSGLGLAPIGSVVVETDGAIEACDALTATFPAAGALGLSVSDGSFDDALRHPLVRERQAGADALASTCLTCELMAVCGGGVHNQRFRDGQGFRNPSVYCPDLYRLIHHVRATLVSDLARGPLRDRIATGI